MTRTWTEETTGTPISPARRTLLMFFGLALAIPALFGIIRVAGATLFYNEMAFSEAILLTLVLALPYASGLLLFFLGFERLSKAKAIKKTLVVLAITAASIAILKLVMLAAASLSAGFGGGSSDSDSDSDSDNDAPATMNHIWSNGWSSETTQPTPSSQPSGRIGSACLACGRLTGSDSLGFCAACSAVSGAGLMR